MDQKKSNEAQERERLDESFSLRTIHTLADDRARIGGVILQLCTEKSDVTTPWKANGQKMVQ